MGAEVPVLAPVAAEGAVHTGQAPGGKEGSAQGSAPGQGCSHLQALPETQPSWENNFCGGEWF